MLCCNLLREYENVNGFENSKHVMYSPQNSSDSKIFTKFQHPVCLNISDNMPKFSKFIEIFYFITSTLIVHSLNITVLVTKETRSPGNQKNKDIFPYSFITTFLFPPTHNILYRTIYPMVF